ncbi:MAG: hypothetical protein QOI10_3211 [Solirubrobacterales bacterium]|jgi:hypothetical protein|nr:hypothetical protein [Solirubrobacterales bacterium]
MRRFVPAAIAAALALAVLAVPASARIDHHFSVISNQVSQHQHGDTFSFREQLFQIDNPANQVGNDHVSCHESPSHKFKCRAIVHLNGEIGGFGFLRVNGNIGRDDSRLNVLGGTDDFSGAAGKVITHGNHLHFDIVR